MNDATPDTAPAAADPWDVVAEGYAATTMAFLTPFAEAALDRLSVGTGDRVADIACGPGTLAERAALRGAEVDAVDRSAAMIALLRGRLTRGGVRGVRPRLGDGQALRLPSGAHDAAFSMFGLMFFADRAAGFAEMARVLRPGGRACVSSWARPAEASLFSVLGAALRAVDPDGPAAAAGWALDAPDGLVAEMAAAGFEDVSVAEKRAARRFASAEAAWEDLAAGSVPLAVLLARLPRDEWRRRADAGVRAVEAAIGSFPATLGAAALLGVGATPS